MTSSMSHAPTPPPLPAGTGRRRRPAAEDAISLYRMKAGEVWGFFRRQQLSFWLLALYMFWEYVRPQDIYPSLANLGLPFWTIVICLVVFLFEGNQLRPWTLADTLLAIFSLVVLASSATAYMPSRSLEQFSIYFSWVLIYFLITNIVNSEGRFFVFMLLYLLYCVKMTQHGVRGWAETGFGFRSWGVSCAPSWFQNSGECGIQMTMLFPVSLFFALALRSYWEKPKLWIFAVLLPFGAVITMIASSSRGAILGLAGVAIWMVAKSKQRVKGLAAIAVLGAAVFFLLPPEQKARFQEMGDDGTSTSRTTYWEHGIEIMNDYPVLGIGYENWLPYYRNYYDPRGEVSHNIFVQAGSELGYTGLFAFVALIIGTFVLNHRTRALAKPLPSPTGRFFSSLAHGLDGALVGFMITGFFVTVLYYPFFWINLAMTVALHSVTAARAGAQRRGSAPRRRPVGDPRSVSTPLLHRDPASHGT